MSLTEKYHSNKLTNSFGGQRRNHSYFPLGESKSDFTLKGGFFVKYLYIEGNSLHEINANSKNSL